MKTLANLGILALVCMVILPVCAWIMPDMRADSLAASVCAGAALGVMHIFLKPLVKLITAPIGCATLGLFSIVIDVGLIYLSTLALGGFHISGLMGPAITAVVINIVCALANKACK